MGFKNKIFTVALIMLIAGLGVLSVGTCGHGYRDFSAFARPAYADSGLKIHR